MAYVKCPKCKEHYSDDMYSCMNGGGEDTRAYITVLDESYVLCPKCAGKLYKWLWNKEDILMRDKLVNWITEAVSNMPREDYEKELSMHKVIEHIANSLESKVIEAPQTQ